MKRKKLCSLLMTVVTLASVTAFSSCDALDGVFKAGESIFDQMMGAAHGVIGGLTNNGSGGGTGNSSGTQTLKVKSIAVDTTNAKTQYAFAEEFTTEGLKVIATMSDGSTQEVALSECRIVKPDTSKPGTRTVTVVYQGNSTRYEIKVATKAIPPISATSLLDITAENLTEPYRVEAEAIDMVTPGVKKAEGVESFVADAPVDADVTSGDKYLTGFNVAWNYFGFTFTAAENYENTSIVLRVANTTAEDLNTGVMKMFLNFAQDEEGVVSGALPLDGYILEANGTCKWTDVVIRNVTIPQGTNTITFEVQGEKTFDIDYIDFYVGMRYLNSSCTIELTEGANVVQDIENFDTEKAFTREDVANREGLKDGQLFVEQVTKESPGKSTNGGTSVGAIGQGSQLTAILSLEQDATVRIKFKAARTANDLNAYYVADDWDFYIDDMKLELVERVNILGGSVSSGMWWDWRYTNVGTYNLSAGVHFFLMNVVGSAGCNVDTVEFEVLSYGEYAPNGSDLNNQHLCESVCPTCGKCTDYDCVYDACIEKCTGRCGYDAYITEDGTSCRIEAEDLSFENLVGDSKGVQVEVRPHVTGVGHISQGGYQTFKVKSEKDVTVALSISFANCDGGSILQYLPGGYINGEEIQFLDGEVPKGTGTAKDTDTYYWNLVTLKLAEIELKANTEYEIKILVNAGNLDAYILDVIPEHVHTEETVAGKAATCTETGLTEGKKCSECGETLVEQEVIPAKGHTEVVDAAVAATCTETGKTEGKHCSVCSEVLVEQETVDALGHKDVDPVDFVCDVCNTDLCTEHQAGEPVKENEVESTCEKAGSYESVVKCSVCGEELSRTTVALEKADHTAGDAVVENDVASTCKVAGSYDNVVYCSVCSAEMNRNTVEKDLADHTWDNNQDVDCNVCGETRVVTLTTPDNSNSKLFYAPKAGIIEVDRSGSTMFVTGTDYVVLYVYEAADANQEDYVAQFKLFGLVEDPGTTAPSSNVATMDDSTSVKVVSGINGNLWIQSGYSDFYTFFKDLLGYDYSDGQTYYFAAQAIAIENSNYADSEISAIGANGFARDASKGTEKYTVTVQNGTIDGELTTVTAGYGVDLAVAANAFENDEFGTWKYVTVGEDGQEVIGDIYSTDATFTLTVTSSITIRAVGLSEIQKIKLATIDNTNNEMMNFNGKYTEYDRHKDANGNAITVFTEGVDYVRYYMYRDITNEAGETEKQLVSWFDLTSDGYLIDYNGNTFSKKCSGEPGNYYGSSGLWHNFIKESYKQGAVANGLADSSASVDEVFNADTTYFACQARTNNTDIYEHGEIGTMGSGWVTI